ncbi:MAG: hypothetical protein NXY57DRAFT_1036946, partial [Lentinula lateritia]
APLTSIGTSHTSSYGLGGYRVCLGPVWRDTLIRYLLDELNTYEEDHSNALAPIDRRASESHAGSTIKKEFAAIYTSQHHHLPQGSAPYGPYPYQGYIWPSLPVPKPSLMPSLSSYLSQMAAPAPNQVIYSSTGSFTPQPSTKILPELDYLAIIPKIRPSPSAWKQDWKPEWAKVTQQAALYGQRKLIALEFIERFKRDDLAIQQAYDCCQDGITQLLLQIRASKQESGTKGATYISPIKLEFAMVHNIRYKVAFTNDLEVIPQKLGWVAREELSLELVEVKKTDCESKSELIEVKGVNRRREKYRQYVEA